MIIAINLEIIQRRKYLLMFQALTVEQFTKSHFIYLEVISLNMLPILFGE